MGEIQKKNISNTTLKTKSCIVINKMNSTLNNRSLFKIHILTSYARNLLIRNIGILVKSILMKHYFLLNFTSMILS